MGRELELQTFGRLFLKFYFSVLDRRYKTKESPFGYIKFTWKEEMGSIFSTFLLLGGAAVSSVLSAIAARAAAQKNWGKALKYAIISAVLSGIVVLTSLAIVIKNKSSAVTGEVVPGVDLSLILMSVVMAVMTGLNSYAAYEASSSSGKTTRKAEEFAAIAATVGLSAVVLSFVMIILLA